MNKNYIKKLGTDELYNYYWEQIQKSAAKFDGVEPMKMRLQNFANNTLGVKMLSPQMTNELCKSAINSLVIEILSSSNDVAFALEFLKTAETGKPTVNRSEFTYTNKLISDISNTLSLSLHEVTKSKQVIDIDKLRTDVNAVISNFYNKYPEYRGASVPIKELQNEVRKVFDNAFEIRKTLKSDKREDLGFQQ